MSIRFGFILLVLCLSCKKGLVKSSILDNCEPNTTSSYYLCLDSLSNSKSTEGSIRFRLVSKEGEQVIDGEIARGRVGWLDEYTIEIFETPGMIPTQLTKEDLIRVYNLKTKSFLTKRQYLESKGL